MIQPERVRPLNGAAVRRGDFVLYWMQAAQRAECNHALEYAVRQANGLGKPLVAFFGLTPDFPEANERHYAFMLEGLKETQAALRDRGIRLVVRLGRPEEGVVRLGRRAALTLNNRYELDGRDPKAFAGVAWCFGKHDRPWARRPVFGTVRYMNAAGLRRKFDADAYVRKVEALAAASGGPGSSPIRTAP